MDKKYSKLISWSLVVVWMSVIFSFSAQPADVSAELSSGVTQFVYQVAAAILPLDVETGTGELDFGFLHFLTRKGAHAFSYFILALFVISALTNHHLKGRKLYLWALGVCILYAITDEVHQIFVPGRAGLVADVLIDSMGAMLGLAVFYLLKGKRLAKKEILPVS